MVHKLQVNKGTGVDDFNSTFIKGAIKGLRLPLLHIYNESNASGVVPKDWRAANVLAIYKKGTKSPGNYQPISLTSQIGKLMERVVKNQLLQHLESSKILNDSQHEFRSKRSCLTNLLKFFQSVMDFVDDRNW